MRAATKGVESWPSAGQRILEPPKAGEVEVFGEPQDEADDGFDIAVPVIMDPEAAALGGILLHEIEASDIWVVSILIRSAKFLKQRERAGGLVGAADVEQA